MLNTFNPTIAAIDIKELGITPGPVACLPIGWE